MPKGGSFIPASGAQGEIAAAIAEVFQDRLGPRWLDAARNIVPFRSGALYRALDYGVDDSNKADVILRVGVNPATPENVDYGSYVERGTSRMKAQPFVVPALGQIGARL